MRNLNLVDMIYDAPLESIPPKPGFKGDLGYRDAGFYVSKTNNGAIRPYDLERKLSEDMGGAAYGKNAQNQQGLELYNTLMGFGFGKDVIKDIRAENLKSAFNRLLKNRDTVIANLSGEEVNSLARRGLKMMFNRDGIGNETRRMLRQYAGGKIRELYLAAKKYISSVRDGVYDIADRLVGLNQLALAEGCVDRRNSSMNFIDGMIKYAKNANEKGYANIGNRGYARGKSKRTTFFDILVGLAIIGILACFLPLPLFFPPKGNSRLDIASRNIKVALRTARSYAIVKKGAYSVDFEKGSYNIKDANDKRVLEETFKLHPSITFKDGVVPDDVSFNQKGSVIGGTTIINLEDQNQNRIEICIDGSTGAIKIKK